MGTLMLLGGSNCQLAAAKAVKAKGHRLVLADYLPTPPAAAYCDRHVRVSTFDVPGCIRVARENRVDGVFTVGTDQPVYTAARVAAALGLPAGITEQTALCATNKRAMKAAFAQAGIPNAPYAYLRRGATETALRGLALPLVIKPLDSQGQRGVFLLPGAAEAVHRLEETLQYSREDAALVETYYPSDEVTFSGYLLRGTLYPLLLTDRLLVRDSLHIGVCAAHRYPSVWASRAGEITDLCRRAAQAIGAREGPLYVQLLVGRQGIRINEVACRVGGAFEDVTVRWATGFDMLDAVIGSALGEPWDERSLTHAGVPGLGVQLSVQMLFCRPGRVASITPVEQIAALPGVLSAGYNYAPGSDIPAMQNATARFGHCVLATDRGDMPTLLAGLYQTLAVTDAEGRPMLMPPWRGDEGDYHA